MQKSTKHGIIVVVAVVGIAAGVYFYSKKAKTTKITAEASKLTKEDVIQEIITNPKSGITSDYNSAYGTLSSFGEDYLKAWYVALKSGNSSFKLNNQIYSASGGKAIAASAISVPSWVYIN